MLTFPSVSSFHFLHGRAKKKKNQIVLKTTILETREVAQCLSVLSVLSDTQVEFPASCVTLGPEIQGLLLASVGTHTQVA